jgi:hypothetical protein
MDCGVAVYFGYPQAHKDDPERGVLAAVQLLRTVSTRSSLLELRIGIATGMIEVGDLIGSDEVRDDGIVTKARDLSACREGSAEPNTIIVDEPTRELIGNVIEGSGPQDQRGLAIRQVAEIARVPQEHRASFRLQVADLIFDSTRAHIIGNDPSIAQLLKVAVEDFLELFLQVLQARTTMASAAGRLQLALEKLANYCEIDYLVDVPPKFMDQQLNDILNWANRTPVLAAKLTNKKSRRGRPPGPTYRYFHEFVCSLVAIVHSVGGRLSFDKNRPADGTLVQALTLLRPHMPLGFVPQVPPSRVLQSAQKIGRGGHEAVEALVTGRLQEFPLPLGFEDGVNWNELNRLIAQAARSSTSKKLSDYRSK